MQYNNIVKESGFFKIHYWFRQDSELWQESYFDREFYQKLEAWEIGQELGGN